MKLDNQKDVRLSTTRQGDTAVLTAAPWPIKRELTDIEIASVVGGLSALPIYEPPKRVNWT